jgi:hypothetical protein
MTVFETETMAELCVKQGLVTEALAIYRRLVADAADEPTRARRAARLAELQRIAKSVAATRAAEPRAPSVLVVEPRGESSGEPFLTLERRADTLAFAWGLPPETRRPALQLLLLRRGAEGIEAETRTLPLEATRGTTTVDVAALHSVRAAAGWLDGDRFVPLVRLAAQGP